VINVGIFGSLFLGTTDAALSDAFGQIQDYFTTNLPLVVGLFVAIAGVLWLLAMGFKSAGVKRKSKVG
jgi:hypothetical protein